MADVTTTSTQSQVISPGFPLLAKLMLLCSPLFLSLPHCWRMLTLQNLGELRPDYRLFDMFQYLGVEIVFSIMSVPVSMFADATIGLTASMISFLSISFLAPVLSSVAGLPGFDSPTRVYMLKFGAAFIGLGIIASVIERAFFVRLMHVNSPTFRLYCFLCYFFSTAWQIVNALVLYTPKIFPDFYKDNCQLMAWLQIVYQCVLWSYMMIMYSVIARFKRPEFPESNSFKVIICIYLAIFYAFKMIWKRLRWKQLPYKDVFEACEQWFPSDVVNSVRKTFRLFIVLMCLMYLFGMELILRTVWFHQDDELSRHRTKPSIWAVFPLELMLLLYLVVLYPIVNFLVLPFIKNKLHIRLSDLRLLGIALIFFNLSYIATMALEWTLLSAATSSPHPTNIAIRVYNCMLNPATWTVEHSGFPKATIFIPARMSRMYVNDITGDYRITVNSSVFNYATSMYMNRGKSRVFIMREDGMDQITALEHQLTARPDFNGDDTHLFVLNGLANSTKEYLAKKHVEVSWRAENGPTDSTKITSNVTHIVLKEATFDITLKLGKTTFNIQPMKMNDHGVYSLMFYDSWGGDEGYEVDTVSVGFVYSRGWANIQIILLAIGMAVGQIPMVHYTYRNAPPDMVATCFSFHRCACAISTFLVYIVTSKYGLGPGPSTISTMLVIMFTVFFIFLSVSDIVPSNDDADVVKTTRIQREGADDISANSGSLKFIKSTLAIDPQADRKSKTHFSDRDSIVLDEKDK